MSAIFLLVVLAALGAMMVTFTTVQHTTAAQDVQGARAYQAARAGVEWGVFRVLRSNPAGCDADTSLSFGGALSGIAVSVSCAASAPVADEGRSVTHYAITATATTGTNVGATDFVERRIEVTLEREN